MSKEVVQFFKDLCTNSPVQLNILRYHARCVLLGHNPSKISLFMHVPEGRGKSVYANFMLSLMDQTGVRLNASKLGDDFALANLSGKELIVFPEVNTTDPATAFKNRFGFLPWSGFKQKSYYSYYQFWRLLTHFSLPITKNFQPTQGRGAYFTEFVCFHEKTSILQGNTFFPQDRLFGKREVLFGSQTQLQ